MNNRLLNFIDNDLNNYKSDNNNNNSDDNNKLEQQRWSLMNGISIGKFLSTSLGPNGGDKMIVDQNGQIQVTNDGWTIIKSLSRQSQTYGLSNRDIYFEENDEKQQSLQQQYHQQNNNNNDNDNDRFNSESSYNRLKMQSVIEIIINCCNDHNTLFGDGTTTIVVLIGAMCQSVLQLLEERSIHRSVIIKAFKDTLLKAINLLDSWSIPLQLNSDKIDQENNNPNQPISVNLNDMGECSLNSKSISYWKKELTTICINAIQYLNNNNSKQQNNNNKDIDILFNNHNNNNNLELDLNLIRLFKIEGGSLEDTKLIRGIVMKRYLSHESMPKVLEDIKVAVISFPLEVEQPTNRYTLHLTAEDMSKMVELINTQQQRFIDRIKSIDAKLVVCQWGIDPAVNQMLSNEGISALSWVSGDEIERISMVTGATIVWSLDALEASTLGHIGKMSEQIIGNDSTRFIFLEDHRLINDPKQQQPIQTIVIRGGSEQMCQEVEECIKDCLSVLANCYRNPKTLVGGGVTELNLYTTLNQQTDNNDIEYDLAMKGWCSSLLSIPSSLIENTGMLDGNDILWNLIQMYEKMGAGCNLSANLYYGTSLSSIEHDKQIIDISREKKVFELLDQKKSILTLATETVCLITQIDSFILSK